MLKFEIPEIIYTGCTEHMALYLFNDFFPGSVRTRI